MTQALRQLLREDQEDLAAPRILSRERAMSYENFLDKLKVDGALWTARHMRGIPGNDAKRILRRMEPLRDDPRVYRGEVYRSR